ncbi:MAG: 2OG-Fe(II) oxygenase [Dokdonella sp.]|uniref:2OG-Fe(II) oxygenase n=1 Tax=Dokdonella sp. TaxID=2291710 RepID=UPI00326534DF
MTEGDAPDFIEVIDGAVDPKVCAELIAAFEASSKVVRGATAGGVNTRLKDSWDLDITRNAEWKSAENLLNGAMMQGMLAYLRKYTYLALAPTALYRKGPAGDGMVMLGIDDVRALSDADLQRLVIQLFRPGGINLQRYFADQGGYPYWHSEIAPRAGNDDNLHRVLLWTVYLNDDFDAGETEFLYQHRKITPKTGSLLIAPAGFTHTHRGNMPVGGNKYIATSWVLFQRAEQMYADPSKKTP